MRRESIAAAAGLCLGFASANTLLACNHPHRCLPRSKIEVYNESACEQDASEPYAVVIERLAANNSVWVWVHIEKHPFHKEHLIGVLIAAASENPEHKHSEAP